MKKVHYFSGLYISLFLVFHLTNHLFALAGPEKHIEVMEIFRRAYRNILFESLLIFACGVQIFSGLNLFFTKRKELVSRFDRLHIYSGLYLAFFLIIHPSAIFAGRWYHGVDTNFWYGATVVNLFPLLLFFVPYYFLAVVAFFTHVACIHRKKVAELGWQVNGDKHAKWIMTAGAIISLLILAGLTGYFQGLPMPDEYIEIYR